MNKSEAKINNDKLSIYCCYHQKELIEYKTNNDLIWYYTGDNPFNHIYCELLMHKWIYENDINSNYIGVCHYRRQFNKNNVNINLLDNESCYFFEKIPFWDIKQYCKKLYAEWLIDDYFDYLKLNNYDIELYTKKYDYNYMRLSFIMNRIKFMEWCRYMFGFIDFIDQKHNLNKDYNNYINFIDTHFKNEFGEHTKEHGLGFNKNIYRVFSFFIENLSSDFINANFKNKIHINFY